MTKEYRRNETGETYESIWLFSRPALFSNGRIDRDTLPKGLCAYDLRGSDDDPGMPISIENHVSVNHAGSVITAEPLPLQKKGFLLLDEEGLDFTGDEQTLGDFLAAVRRRARRVNQRKLARAAAWVTRHRKARFARNVRIVSEILEQTRSTYSDERLRVLYRADECSCLWNSAEVQAELRFAAPLAVRMREKRAPKSDMQRIGIYILMLLYSDRYPIDLAKCSEAIGFLELYSRYD
nr:MAG TPA: Large polyvalent protein associated domain 28 [Caudoviricetes sp.]